jgi:AcrR family transcriptional regulator
MDMKTQVLDTARELFMRYGVKSVTMDDLARELGISKKTLYQTIDKKADLIRQVIVQFLEGEQEAINFIRSQSENAISEMLAISKHLTTVLRQLRPSTVYDLQKYYRSAWKLIENHHRNHVYSVIRQNLVWGMEEGLYRKNLDPEIIARLYVGRSFILVDESVFSLQENDRNHLLEQFIQYHIHGIASPEGLRELDKQLSANIPG